MERRLMEMLDTIEVPEDTTRKVEEMMMRELVHKKQEQTNLQEKRVKMEMKEKQPRWIKVLEASAAAIALAAGLTAAVYVFHTEDQGAVVSKGVQTMDGSVLSSLKERKLYELKEGKNLIDLDQDGALEEVVVKNISTGTTVTEFTITVGDQTIKGEVDREEGLKVRAGMLTKEKDCIQLLFTSQYLSEDYITEVYNYEEKKLIKVGSFAEEVDNLKISEDGSFTIVQQGGVLGRTKTTHISMVENPKTDPSVTGKYWLEEVDTFEQTIPYEYEVTALQDVTVYKEKAYGENTPVAMELKEGDVAKTIRVEEEQWLYIENESGERGYIEVHLGDIEINGKGIPGWQVFDGLPFVD